MIPKEAIEKAIEGGWNTRGFDSNEWGGVIMHDAACEITLDPLFWQSLGNALDKELAAKYAAQGTYISFTKWDWRKYASTFCDFIFEGRETQVFWDCLLGK